MSEWTKLARRGIPPGLIVAAVCCASLLMFSFGIAVGSVLETEQRDKIWREKAIEAGVGRYHPETGQFEFGRRDK